MPQDYQGWADGGHAQAAVGRPAVSGRRGTQGPRLRWGVALAALLLAATALILFQMGREPICKCGYIKLWHGEVVSSENSQHLTDWYTPSHILHGILFFGAFWLLNRLPRVNLTIGARLALATLVECAWEIAENTDAVIQRYREATIALDYFGDSIVNSSADITAMWIGFAIAARAPVWVSDHAHRRLRGAHDLADPRRPGAQCNDASLPARCGYGSGKAALEGCKMAEG